MLNRKSSSPLREHLWDCDSYIPRFPLNQGSDERRGGTQLFDHLTFPSFNPTTFQEIRASGGWSEAYCYVTDRLHLHAGCGIDALLLVFLNSTQIIRDPYVSEFRGIRAQDALGESDQEGSLLEHLRDFRRELGHGFCCEARQKRILIGDVASHPRPQSPLISKGSGAA